MAKGIRTGAPPGFSKECSSKFREGSWVRQTPEEGQRAYRPRYRGNNNKDEDNSPKTLNDKNHPALFQKFRQLKFSIWWIYPESIPLSLGSNDIKSGLIWKPLCERGTKIAQLPQHFEMAQTSGIDIDFTTLSIMERCCLKLSYEWWVIIYRTWLLCRNLRSFK